MRTPGFRGARWQQCSIKYIGIAASAVATVLGIGLAVFKPLSLNSALVIAGAITLAAGIIKICGYFAGDMYCLAYQYDFAMGTLAIAAGTLMIIRGENDYSCAALGALAAADCMLKIRTAREARSFGLHSWPALLLTALLAAAGGVVLGFGGLEGDALTRMVGVGCRARTRYTCWAARTSPAAPIGNYIKRRASDSASAHFCCFLSLTSSYRRCALAT